MSSLPAPPADDESGSPWRWLSGLAVLALVGVAITAVALAASSPDDRRMAEGRGVTPSDVPLVDPMAGGERRADPRPEVDGAELSRARSAVNVELYSTTWCPRCTEARAYLTAQGIAYTEYDVDSNEAAKARLHTMHPRGSIPFLVLDGEPGIVGFSERSYEDAIDRAARTHLN